MECETDHRSVEVEVFNSPFRLEVVVQVSPHGEDVPPTEGIADAARRLPRQLRLPGADIGVERHEPFALFLERVAPLDPDDAVPERRVDLPAAVAAQIGDRTEVTVNR